MPKPIATTLLKLPLALAAVTPAVGNTEPRHSQAVFKPLPTMVVFSLPRSPKAELLRSADGLFYLDALVNDIPVRFLVDTGANAVVLTAADARRAGVVPDPVQPDELAQTAGGRVAMSRTRLRSLEAGPMRKRDVEVAVTGAGLPVSLLGQSWLSQLGSVTIAGDRMVPE